MGIVNKTSKTILLLLFVATNILAQQTTEIQLANEYYGQGEYEKARTLYEDLAKDFNNITLIHNNYYFLLLETANYNDAEKYIKKLIKRFPENLYYKLDLGLLIFTEEGENQSDIYFKNVIDDIKYDNYLVSITADYFVNKKLTQYAVLTFTEGRTALNNPYLFSLELANIYRIMNEKDKMVEEYLNYVIQNPANLSSVKNTLQTLLNKPDELQSLERLLYDKIQQNPQSEVYSELLIWVNLQQKNFYGAFLQARAIDKRLRSEGSRTLNIGMIALNNNDYNNAIKIFSYLIQNYPGSNNYLLAKMYLIRSYEQRVRNTYPIDEREIRNLVNDYNEFIKELGVSRNTLEALRNKALLHAFYLDEKDSAIAILEKIVETPRANPEIKSKSKLDLGDIYLLKGESWESSLLYSQVEKSNKEDDLGYIAKLKNAKLSYYKGNFKLAEEHLDILKEATTREIANDAMALSLLIKDNTVLDTSDVALQEYANIELLLFQHKTEQAKLKIDSMLTNFPNHSLTDELLWLKADLLKKEGKFTESISLLDRIVEQYGSDILSDDAYFSIADIYDRQLNEKERAMEYYRNFLTKYPGSVFIAEARKRFRELRGDFDAREQLVN
ncbi:tetratricopeptide repeat protein [Fulvivirga lutea]|uniref:Tetratricopeptide repeat protein n=1 Tax=Fulvivirga lutea TaxID=2810512 RepID=A0A975A241_9BACT|nr:tetratricopeptide repeat protein [Fulvivirga lutea]